jgi:hypothetical protein
MSTSCSLTQQPSSNTLHTRGFKITMSPYVALYIRQEASCSYGPVYPFLIDNALGKPAERYA